MKHHILKLLVLLFLGVLFFSCDEEKEDDCYACTTSIKEKNVELKNTDLQNPESTQLTSVFLYRHNNSYVVDYESSGCFSQSKSHYYVCNPYKVKSLLKNQDTVCVDIVANIREKKPEEEEIFADDLYHYQETADIEILKIRPTNIIIDELHNEK